MSYKLLSAQYPFQLESKVREAMSAGWVPQGGPFMQGDNLIQAVVYKPQLTEEQVERIRGGK